jgi:hypothetical protein
LKKDLTFLCRKLCFEEIAHMKEEDEAAAKKEEQKSMKQINFKELEVLSFQRNIKHEREDFFFYNFD